MINSSWWFLASNLSIIGTLRVPSSLFWDFGRYRLVVCYWCFETTCGFHLRGPNSEEWKRMLVSWKTGPRKDTWFRNVAYKRRVTSQKTVGLSPLKLHNRKRFSGKKTRTRHFPRFSSHTSMHARNKFLGLFPLMGRSEFAPNCSQKN